jgi:hypothetical protein
LRFCFEFGGADRKVTSYKKGSVKKSPIPPHTCTGNQSTNWSYPMITDQTPRTTSQSTQQQLAVNTQRVAMAGTKLGYKRQIRFATTLDWQATIDRLKGKPKSEPEALRSPRLASRRKRATA